MNKVASESSVKHHLLVLKRFTKVRLKRISSVTAITQLIRNVKRSKEKLRIVDAYLTSERYRQHYRLIRLQSFETVPEVLCASVKQLRLLLLTVQFMNMQKSALCFRISRALSVARLDCG